MKKSKKYFKLKKATLNSILVAGLSTLSLNAIAYHGSEKQGAYKKTNTTSKSFKATAVTGPNRILGEPVWNLGHGLGQAGFTFLGGYNPHSTTPTELTPYDDKETVLATILDNNYLGMLGLVESDIDPNLINVPLRDVAVIADPAGNRKKFSSVTEVIGGKPSKSAPNNPITLKQWLKGEGSLRVQCKKDGTSILKFKFRNLIENGIYTVWGVYANEGGGNTQLGLYPLGGVPNTFVAGKGGRASMRRFLNFCPMDETVPGSTTDLTTTLLTIDVVYHSDGAVYAGSSDLALAGFPGGTISHTHMVFPIHAEPLSH